MLEIMIPLSVRFIKTFQTIETEKVLYWQNTFISIKETYIFYLPIIFEQILKMKEKKEEHFFLKDFGEVLHFWSFPTHYSLVSTTSEKCTCLKIKWPD